LVANVWDADATRVEITLHEPLTTDPIVIADNGYGMSPGDVSKYYEAHNGMIGKVNARSFE